MAPESDAVPRILGVLKEHPEGLNIVEIAEKTGLNRMSVAKYLGVLTANESVEVEMCGRAKIYSLSRRLPVRAFLEQISKCYCITDSNLRVVQFNHWLPTISDIPPREIEGALLPDIFQDRILNFGECLAACRKAIAGEVSVVIADDLVRGKHKFLEIYHLPIRFPDGSPGMIAVTQEVTDRKLMEIELHQEAEQLRALVERMAYPVFRAGTDGILTYLSPRATELGLAPGTCTGRLFSDLAVQEDREAVDVGLRVIPESVEGSFRFRVRRPDGRIIMLEAGCMAQRDPAGMCTGVTGVLREVTGEPGRHGSRTRCGKDEGMTTEPDAISRILGVLKEHPEGLNIVEIAEKTGLNRMSVAKYLDVLTAQEMVETGTFGRAKIYSFAGRRVPAADFRKRMPLHYAITDSSLTILQLNDFVPRTTGRVGARLPDLLRGRVANYDECIAALEAAVAGRECTFIAEFLSGPGSGLIKAHCVPIQLPDGSPGMMVLKVDIPREKFAVITDPAGESRDMQPGGQ
ncbi:MAG: PAS domain-containing protein [Methanoregula sp.]|nr:PAS domain-containing protein [Methanoregula sp.]